MNTTNQLKCKKCRHILINRNNIIIVLDAHSEPITNLTNRTLQPCLGKLCEVIYLEDLELPNWIFEQISNGEWQKGKLTCPKCDARIGSFDFISGNKCPCEQYVLPPIRIVKSKVDIGLEILRT